LIPSLGVGEALAAVVAGEDDDRVVEQPPGAERPHDATDLLVHRLDHPLVGPLRPAVQIEQAAGHRAEPLGLGFVAGPFPRPVRRIEVEAQHERLA
jgi:hypothetical protein